MINSRQSGKEYGTVIIIFLLLVFIFTTSGCAKPSAEPEPLIPSPAPDQPPSNQQQITTLEYPFAHKNMFFGLSLINPERDAAYVRELGVSWLSLQPHVIWFTIENEPGVYDWSYLDREVNELQTLGLDITMVLSPIYNAFGEERTDLVRLVQGYASILHFLRQGDVADLQLYPHDDTLPLWVNFVRAAVDRYDGDGDNDMPGLKYRVRNWHFVEEYPIPGLKDEKIYVELLRVTCDAIKREDPEAKVILAGLAGNYARYFAFIDGFIQDEEAGVYNSKKYKRSQLASNTLLKKEKEKYEYILKNGKDYFDIIDLHAYIIKEAFMEGEIEYINHTMRKYGFSRPVWIIEGGGPFKNYPGKRAENTPADPYFGVGSQKENAEFVIKLHVMSAAKGVERQHWGWGLDIKEGGYWDGPWCGMGLMDPDEGFRKPSYYTFKIMQEKLHDFTQVQDLSSGNLRVFIFNVSNQKVGVVWNTRENSAFIDLGSILGDRQVKITHIVTELDADNNPVYLEDEVLHSTSIPVSTTPVFIEVTQ